LSQQDSSYVTSIYLTDGSKLVGKILAETATDIKFKTSTGIELTIERAKIKKIEKTEGDWYKGEFRRYDPNRTRLLFSPTARSLLAGKGYFSIYQVFFPMLSVGITDFITLSGGISLFPGVNLDGQLLYVAPKIRILHTDQFDLSSGVLYVNALDETSFGVIYGVGTYGSPSASLTAGLGWGYAEDDVADKPLLIIGGEIQVSGSVKLITENWIPPGTNVTIHMFGIRFFGESLAGDFGLLTSSEAGGAFPFLPWIGFVYNF